jgi:hypothetical protein
MPHGYGFNRVALIAGTFPRTWYLVQQGYNTFTLRENATDTVITITPANYTRTGFVTYICNLLTTSSPNGCTYSATVPQANNGPDTGKITWTVTGGVGVTSAFVFGTYLQTSVNEQMGFLNDSTNTFVGGSLVSANINTFSPELTIYLHSNIVDEKDDIVASIYDSGNTPQFGYMIYRSFDARYGSRKYKGTDGGLFSFSIQNEKGITLNTNGLNIVFEIFIYRDDASDFAEKQQEAWDRMAKSILGLQNMLGNTLAKLEQKQTDPFVGLPAAVQTPAPTLPPLTSSAPTQDAFKIAYDVAPDDYQLLII